MFCYNMLLYFTEKKTKLTANHHYLSFLNCDDYVDVISFRKHYGSVHFRGCWSEDWTLDPIQWSRFKYRRTKLPQSVKSQHEELSWWLTLTYRARAHKHTLAWCPNYINMWVISLWVSRAMPAARLLSLCLALNLNPAISCLFFAWI